MTPDALLAQDFGSLPALVAAHAEVRPDTIAVVDPDQTLTYRELNGLADRIAASLQRGGLAIGQVAAVCGASSCTYAALFVGILRAGGTVAPLAGSSSAESLASQLVDCDARILFLDQDIDEALQNGGVTVAAERILLDDPITANAFASWLAGDGATPKADPGDPERGFNIIYSSGTTGTPKGIVQPQKMRWAHFRRGLYSASSVTMVATPLYSNTTLVSFLPTLATGGTVILMPKFDAKRFLELSVEHRATHAMLVPVQYRRLMEHPDFDSYDLSTYTSKFCTSAPFAAVLKQQVVARWPGGLLDMYGMTEGGGTCVLDCAQFPDKLHTVGKPYPDHDFRLIDEDGVEVAPGETGEVVGRSTSMMSGYHNQPEKTAEAEWYNPEGLRFIRTGDVGRFDEDGFLVLMDRKKDMIISGGFNIYPSDLEARLIQHPACHEAAVVGVPSDRWGETPVAFVVLKPAHASSADELKSFVNEAVGKTQRLADLRIVEALPRNAIGKVLKRELRDGYAAAA